MLTKTITCPDCGLVLRLSRDDAGTTLIYDVTDWQRRCIRVDLDDPAWCLVRRDGTYPEQEKWTSQLLRPRAPCDPLPAPFFPLPLAGSIDVGVQSANVA